MARKDSYPIDDPEAHELPPLTTEEYLSGSKHGGDGPSNCAKHLPAGRKGQTILAQGGPPNNVGQSSMYIESSLCDETFGGGIDFTELDVMLRDEGKSRAGALRVEDEHGFNGTGRRTESERRQAELDRTSDLARGFISTSRGRP
jgi:hypothetical protein